MDVRWDAFDAWPPPASRAGKQAAGLPAGAGLVCQPPTQGSIVMATFTYDHIHLRTPDPEATAQFYEKMFGAEILRSMQDGKLRIDLKLGGANIFIAPVAAGD